MRLKVRRWGNSASIRIPAPILAAAALKIDQEVEVQEEDGRIVIQPIAATPFDLGAAIANMSTDNFHDEIDPGAPVGEEIW